MKKLLAIATIVSAALGALAQGTTFTYQGRLNSSGVPASGTYDFRFKLYSDSLGNTQVGGSYVTNAVPVSSGLFAAAINFGAGIFTGSNYWLEVDVKTNNAGGYTVLTPLQAVTPAPYAIMANSASNLLGNLPAAQLSGSIANGNLPASPNFSGTVTATAFSGSGAGLANVNANTLNGLRPTNFWQTTGNTGASPASGNYLGTADNQPIEFRVNNARALRLEPNTTNTPNVIGGSSVNYVTTGKMGAAIAGGGGNNFGTLLTNRVTDSFGSVGGGCGNTAAYIASVGGGQNNTAGDAGMVGGGQNNIAGVLATVSGGSANSANGNYGTVGGGQSNVVNGYSAAVGGGEFNSAGGLYSTVPGGFGNNAQGLASFAAGSQALAFNDGTFVWNSFPNTNSVTQPYTFTVLGAHGLDVEYYSQAASGAATRYLYIGDFFSGDTIHAWSGAHLTDGGMWSNSSDKNRKTDFAEMDARAVLEKIEALPVRTWRYTNELSGIKHLGPTAQDFKAAFGLGLDDKSIGTLDESGVALAAIKGLNQKLEEQKTENAGLKARLEKLEQLLSNRKGRK